MIYLVTVGSYADYRVIAATTNRSSAEEYTTEYNKENSETWADEAEIEEVEEV